MQSSSEGQACSFSRMKGNTGPYLKSDFVQTQDNGLRVPRQFADQVRLAADQHQDFQQTLASPWAQRNASSVAPGAPAWTGAQPGSYTDGSTCPAVFGNIPAEMNPTTQQCEMNYARTNDQIVSGMYDYGDAQSHMAVNIENLQHNPSVAQPHQRFIPEGQYLMQPQPLSTTISPRSDFFRNEIGGQAGLHQQGHIHPMSNNRVSVSALTNQTWGAYETDPAVATRETAAVLRGEYYANSTSTLRTGHDVPVSSPQTQHNEVINLDTPTKHNTQLTPELFSRLAPAPEQLKGSEPTQLEMANTPSPDVSPSKSVAAHSGNTARASRNPVAKRHPRRRPSPSIDVDNDDNNACRGRNRPLHEDAIDLSKESSEETISKLKRQEKPKSIERRGESFKFPRTADKGNQRIPDNATSSAGYQDPLNSALREHQEPPPRAFQNNADATQSPRRSPRLTKKSLIVNTATDSGGHAQSGNSPGECDYPLGGIRRENRERKSDGNSYMSRHRSTTKRRRRNHADDASPLRSGPDDLRKVRKHNVPRSRRRPVENQNSPTAQRPKRRTKQERKPIPRKGKSVSGAMSRKSCVKEVGQGDSEDEFYAAMKRRKAFELNSQDSRENHQGDSPLSNTVGDGSHSDDDDIGAGGNELSSDDDAPPPPKRSPRGSRRRPGNSKQRACVDEDSAEASGMARRKTTVPIRGDIPNDCEDDNIVQSRGKSSNTDSKEVVERSSKGKIRREVPVTPSSPVNLISPASSRSKSEKMRRSTRSARTTNHAGEEIEAVFTDDSDEDFDDSRVRTRARRKSSKTVTSGSTVTRNTRKRLNSSREHEDAQNNVNIKGKKLEATNVESGTSEGDAGSSDYSQEGEHSDAPGEFLSQEQGSQPIQLKVKLIHKRKKTNPKEFPESNFKKLSPDELAIIRIAFIKRYPAPPSNMQAQGRYEAAHGTEMSAGMVQRTWETQLKPWSDRWWKLYLNFNKVVREKKLRKPRDKDPTIKEKEVRNWVDEYYQEHGDAKPTAQDTTTSEKAK